MFGAVDHFGDHVDRVVFGADDSFGQARRELHGVLLAVFGREADLGDDLAQLFDGQHGFLLRRFAQQDRNRGGVIAKREIVGADVGGEELADSFHGRLHFGFPVFLDHGGASAELHHEHRKRRGVLNGTLAFGEQQINVGSALQQAGFLVGDGKILHQAA